MFFDSFRNFLENFNIGKLQKQLVKVSSAVTNFQSIKRL